MIRAVIDTNVFLSSLFWKGKPKQILEMAFSKKFEGVTSPQILLELEGKLRKKFNYPEEQTKKYVELILSQFTVVEPTSKVSAVPNDPTDNKIIEAAIEANADYIVTGDKHLLKLGRYLNVKILKPDQFLMVKKSSTALASEQSLANEWLSKEDNETWKKL